jgi:hypothetical protein
MLTDSHDFTVKPPPYEFMQRTNDDFRFKIRGEILGQLILFQEMMQDGVC